MKHLFWVDGSINGLLVVASGRGLPEGRRLSVQGGVFPVLGVLSFPLKVRFWSRCAVFPLVRSRCSEDTPGKALQGLSAIGSCHPLLRSTARTLWHLGWLISVFLSLLQPVLGCTARVRYRSVCVLCHLFAPFLCSVQCADGVVIAPYGSYPHILKVSAIRTNSIPPTIRSG